MFTKKFIRSKRRGIVKSVIEKELNIQITCDPEWGCWFIKDRDWSSYMSINGERAHRLIYKKYRGPLKAGQEICHKCDRRGCINPSHLFQGTHSDNMKDARRKGRLVDIRIKKHGNGDYKQ